MSEKRKKSKKLSVTKAESLLESSRFFVDRCLGKGICAALRDAGLTVEHHDDRIPPDSLDVDWLPIVGGLGLIVLTKDRAILKNASELQAVIAAKVRLFTLPRSDLTGQEMADIYLKNLPAIGRFLKNNEAPFIVSVSNSGLRVVYSVARRGSGQAH